MPGHDLLITFAVELEPLDLQGLIEAREGAGGVSYNCVGYFVFIDPADPTQTPIEWVGRWRTLEQAWTFAPETANFTTAWNQLNFPRLLRNSGRVLTRVQLIDRVWGSDYVGDTKTLDVHVKRLRAKVEPDPASPQFIVTVRGLGYKFETASG